MYTYIFATLHNNTACAVQKSSSDDIDKVISAHARSRFPQKLITVSVLANLAGEKTRHRTIEKKIRDKGEPV